MTLRLIQILDSEGKRHVAAIQDDAQNNTRAYLVNGVSTTLELAHLALSTGHSLAAKVEALGQGAEVNIAQALKERRVLSPIDHQDPAHIYLTGTGLTHLGSAESRNKMHKASSDESQMTDTLRMFKMGLEGGKPKEGEIGVQPEWFYKGNGHNLVAPNAPLTSPSFALDGGEEPEIAGIYIIAQGGAVVRLGYALANEFSDHVTEKGNYLWLAHSKLRPAALGPELYVGELPPKVEGSVRIVRKGETLWEKPFLSGEENMSHSLSNLEHHHFKYDLFRQAGDVHVHFFGTATASFGDGIKTEVGDIFEIEAKPFIWPLSNPLSLAKARPLEIKAL
jgi:hypothetical protein